MEIVDFIREMNIPFDINVDLKSKTWIKRGGITEFWVQPSDLKSFEALISWCQLNNTKFEIIGSSSNCYFLNDYNPKLVISTLKLNKMKVEGNIITCDSGFNISRLAKYCNSNGFSGYEGFIGLPGTVGGAAVNNSGCYGSLISDVLLSIVIIEKGKKKILTKSQLNYQYRSSLLKLKEIDGVITSVNFNISKKDDELKLKRNAKEYQVRRKTRQQNPLNNLGTTFYKLKFKRLPLLLFLVHWIVKIGLRLTFTKKVTRQKINTSLILSFRRAKNFQKYVSDYNIGCFIWKDEGADKAFINYLSFIKAQTSEACMEIEIKKKSSNIENV